LPSPLLGQKQIQNSVVSVQPRSNPYAQTIISLSNNNQVFKDVVLRRKNGMRLYADGGNYSYQNIPKEDRPYLLINGQPTVEPDFGALHGNMLLNREGRPSEKMFYEKILHTLGYRNSDTRRLAIKIFVNASFNCSNKQELYTLIEHQRDDRNKNIPSEERPKLISYLGDIRPKEIYQAIIKTYPAITKYICTGKHYDWLQTTDSKIMISICKRLFRRGVIPLPIHDSCRVVVDKEDICIKTMKKAYKSIMGFEGIVRRG
jgi:hypothetical protein